MKYLLLFRGNECRTELRENHLALFFFQRSNHLDSLEEITFFTVFYVQDSSFVRKHVDHMWMPRRFFNASVSQRY